MKEGCAAVLQIGRTCKTAKDLRQRHAGEKDRVHLGSNQRPRSVPRPRYDRFAREKASTICATHEPGKTIIENPKSSGRAARALGCKHTAYPISSRAAHT